MSFNSREMDVGVETAFAALVDPTTYPRWLVGAESVRDVDATWPQPGSRFHHVVGFGPLKIPDHSEVVEIEPGHLLRLKVKARPFVSAIATFTVVGGDRRCVVSVVEEPSAAMFGRVARVILDPSLHLRNHRSLARLADVLGSS